MGRCCGRWRLRGGRRWLRSRVLFVGSLSLRGGSQGCSRRFRRVFLGFCGVPPAFAWSLYPGYVGTLWAVALFLLGPAFRGTTVDRRPVHSLGVGPLSTAVHRAGLPTVAEL